MQITAPKPNKPSVYKDPSEVDAFCASLQAKVVALILAEDKAFSGGHIFWSKEMNDEIKELLSEGAYDYRKDAERELIEDSNRRYLESTPSGRSANRFDADRSAA